MKEITTKQLKILIDSGKQFILLDCRSEKSFQKEHIPNALNLYLKTIETTVETRLPNKNSLIVTTCDGYLCSVSGHCYEKLEKLGYRNVLEHPGGVAEWKAYGYRTKKGI